MPQRDLLSDITTAALERGLAGVYARQLAIADNLANIETPGYQAKAVSFEQSLRAAIEAERPGRAGHMLPPHGMAGTRHRLIEAVEPRVEPQSAPARPDGNTVNLEAEIVAMSKSSLQYKMLTRLLAKKLGMMQRAINGGSSQ